MNSITALIIETKTENEQFEEYDPYWLYLRVCPFNQQADTEFDQSLFENVVSKSTIIQVHTQRDTVRDLESKVAEALGLTDSSNLVIILRHDLSVSAKTGSTVRSEVYNLAWRKIKTLEEGPKLVNFTDHLQNVTQGVLYIEFGDTKDKQESFKWHKEFNKAYDLINLSINDVNDSEGDQNQFKLKIQAKRSHTLQQLKEQIGKIFGINAEQLILKKNAH